MFYTFFYLIVIFALLLFLLFMIIYTISLLYSSWKGSPYVPTKQKELEYILNEANLKEGKIFLEPGCGDGRVVRTAVREHNVNGIGIDINPLIIHYARFLNHTHNITCDFYVKDIFNTNYSKADYIYLFLMPDLLKKLLPILKKGIKVNAIIISHGFKLHGWEQYLFKTILHAPFPTYFYRLKS